MELTRLIVKAHIQDAGRVFVSAGRHCRSFNY
jgi:hypothetical protein